MNKEFIELIKNMPKQEFHFKKFDQTIYNQVIFEMPKIASRSKTNTIARIFGKSKNENFISDWLAYLLANNEAVLSSILNILNIEYSNQEYLVNREYVFENGRRIDFLIESEDFVIGIENKIDSYEQVNQLKDYSIELDKYADGKTCIKILLKPRDHAIQAGYGFSVMNYEDLLEKLKMIQADFIKDLRGSFLLLDFIKHMEENIVSKENEFVFNEWTEYISKYSDQIKTITKAVETEERNVLDYIKDKVLALVDNENEWSFGVTRYEKSYIQFFKKAWDLSPNIHYEIKRKDNNTLPTEMQLRIDIERGKIQEKDKIKDHLGLEKHINYFEIFKLDYSSEKSFEISVDLMVNRLAELIEKYTDKIDELF